MPTIFTSARRAGVVAVVLGLGAIVAYPGGTPRDPSTRGYSFLQNFLSDLGCFVTYGGRRNFLGATLFFVSLAILVVATAACLPALMRLYAGSRTSRALARAALAAGAVVCAAFLGVALTPEDRSMALHVRFTLLAWRVFPLAALLLALATLWDGRFSRRAALVWLAFSIVLAAYAALLQWGPTVDTHDGLAVQVAAQKIVTLATLVVLAYQSRVAEAVSSTPRR